jgi:pimeloyl-ACP methyl ester carboxylesterase
MTGSVASHADRLTVRDVDLEVIRRGTGRTVVFLHGFQPLDPDAAFLERLSRRALVVAPSHPGFGASARPDDFETVYDLVHLYREFIDTLPDDKVTLVGASFGGWLAAEIAAACPHRLDRLVLVDALSDAALTRHARNRDALCLYGWEPYMYNSRLKRWLGRIARPTLVLWGAADGIVTPAYGRAYAALIPGARFALIEEAGHHPELERPDALADRILDFISN